MKGAPALLLMLCIAIAGEAQEPALKVLQAKADAARGVQCAQLSMHVARHSLEDAHQLFRNGNVDAAHEAIGTMLHYARRSVECTLEARKRQKPVEIELRALIRRVREVARTVDADERVRLTQGEEELERERDRLLKEIFGPAAASASDAK